VTTPIVRPARPLGPRLFGAAAFVVVVGLVLWAWLGVEIKWSRLLDAPVDIWRLDKALFSNLPWSELGEALGAMWDSIAMAWMGTVLAAAVAVPLSFLAAENLAARPVSILTRVVFNVLRAVPEIVLAIVLIPAFGLTQTTAVLALAIGSIGTLGKLCSEVLEGIHPGPIEAAEAVGANQLQRLRWAVLPQSLPEIASFVMYRFEINIRAASVVGILGLGGIGTTLVQSLRFRDYTTAGLALIVTVAGTMLIDFLSGMIRRRLVVGPQRRVLVVTSSSITGLEPMFDEAATFEEGGVQR
jgi:phosphonate transport system permease protein